MMMEQDRKNGTLWCLASDDSLWRIFSNRLGDGAKDLMMDDNGTLQRSTLFFFLCSGQILNTNRTDNGICSQVNIIDSLEKLSQLNGCVTLLGNLKILKMERYNSSHFRYVSYPELREVTGYIVLYSVFGLTSVGKLFPNLTRIRGLQLFDSYALIIHDVPNLTEIGLYNLVKIDRGGVVAGGGPQTCYILTVDWETIAPRYRHVLSPADRDFNNIHCNKRCGCTANEETNHCWNNVKCQRYLEGPDGENCDEQCFGCKKNNKAVCSLCSNYTYKDHCLPKCPNNMLVIPDNKYCVTQKECETLGRWSWNNTCIDECPIDYVQGANKKNKTTCIECPKCQSTCQDLKIQTLSALQQAERCVYVNGSLVIHIRAIPNVMEHLSEYLGRIEEVRDSVVIYGSLVITSLDFLSSLKVIKGVKLDRGSYSLIIKDMESLQTLFSPNVTKNLKIERGKLQAVGNPVLCLKNLEEIAPLFPVQSNDTDIPLGMNGYSGGCNESFLDFKVKVWNETSATIVFYHKNVTSVQYTALYVKLPPGTRISRTVVPETCSDLEWYAVPASSGFVDLVNLRPASTYAICIEIYEYSSSPAKKKLARSKIHKFTTPVGKPAPPFIIEHVAATSKDIVVRWVDHKDYIPHITHYELDVELIDLNLDKISNRDYCNISFDDESEEISRHAVVFRPPPDYDRGCESMCGVLSTLTAGAMVEDYFDICEMLDDTCDKYDYSYSRKNSSVDNLVNTFSVDIEGPRNSYQVGRLKPYRDYRFKLRTCAGKVCSRATRSVVRTLRSEKADLPLITSYNSDISGNISVAWSSPKISNGPILAYLIQVWPYLGDGWTHSQPQSLCHLPKNYKSNNKFNLTVKPGKVSKCKVRVCSLSLGGLGYICTEWIRFTFNIEHHSWSNKNFLTLVITNTLLAGLLFACCIVAISIMTAHLWTYKFMISSTSDVIPLVENIEMNECERPSLLLTNIVPSYSIPLRDTVLLDY